MSKKLSFIIFILFISHCSLDTKSGFWNSTEVKKIKNKKEEKQLFKKVEVLNFEINKDLEIDIESSKFTKNSFKNNLTNNNGRINYDGKLKKALKYKFSKINNFNEFEPEVIFDKDNIIFFSNKGSILKFDDKSKLIWKKNYYTKNEKKLKPILFFANNENTLIVADNIAKIYAMNIHTGELLWSKNNPSAFNSEIKIYKDKFFAIDYDNILRCFSLKNGNEIWKIKTENSILKSQKKLSLVINKNSIFFNNSIGDVMSVNLNTGNLIWILPTSTNTNSSSNYFLKMSNLIIDKNSIYFSTNKNEFYSVDINSGLTNWTQNINSSSRSTVIDMNIFSISDEGYLVILNTKTGEIIRRTNLFSGIKKKKRKKIKPTGFIVGKNKIYLSLNDGKILVVDVRTGTVKDSIKIDNQYISRPFVSNAHLFVIKNNGIIKIE